MKISIKYFFLVLLFSCGFSVLGNEYISFINLEGIAKYKESESRYVKDKDGSSVGLNFVNFELGEETVFEENNRLYVSFAKDKVAELHIGDFSNSFSIQSSLVENTCDYAMKNITCDLELPFVGKIMRLLWVKHPDPEKVGTYLKADNEQYLNASEGKSGLTMFNEEKLQFYEKEFQKMGVAKFKCDNPAFLNSLVENGLINIGEWSFEKMLTNSETETSENRTDMSAFGIKLKKNEMSYNIEQIEYKAFASEENTILSENWGWYVPSKQCNISLKPNIQGAFSTITKLFQDYLIKELKQKFRPMDAKEAKQLIQSHLTQIRVKDGVKGLTYATEAQKNLILLLGKFELLEEYYEEYVFDEENNISYQSYKIKEIQ